MRKRFTELEAIEFAADDLLNIHEKFLTPECLPALQNIQLTEYHHPPTFVWAFTGLKQLSITKGNLENIPPTIGQLTALEHLDLSENKIAELPDSIAQLDELQSLDLSYNALHRIPSLAGLQKLSAVTLSHNKIGRLPESLGRLPRLSLVDVGFNALLTLPDGFVRKQITLRGWANPYIKLNPITAAKLAEDFKRSRNYPDVYSRQKSNTYALFLYVFGQQQDQMDLPLPKSKKRALRIPDSYQIFEKIVVFDYEVRDLPANDFNYFFLKTILIDVHVTELALQSDFGQAKELFPDFSFSINHVPKEKFAEIRAQSDLLRYLEELPPHGIDLLENWEYPQQVTSIVLSNQELTEVPEWLVRYTKLRQLDLSYNQLTSLPQWLDEFDQLEELKLNANQLTLLPKVVPAHLSWVNLSHNRLETLPKEWIGLPHLEWLDLSYNQLKQLPQNGWQMLSPLQELKLQHNRLTQLPEAMLDLINLERVMIDHNLINDLPIDFILNGWVKVSELVANYGNIAPELVNDYSQALGEMVAVSPQEFTGLFCLAHFHPNPEVRQVTKAHLKIFLKSNQRFCVEGWEYQPVVGYVSLLRFLQKVKATLDENLVWEGIDIWVAKLQLQTHKRVLLAQQQLTDLPNFTLKHWQNPWVDLSGNELATLPHTLTHILALSRLDLSQNMLQALGNQGAIDISQVKNLNLADNFIEHLPPALFAECPRLVQLNLSHNQLESLPTIHQGGSRVKQLDLSCNLFTHIPSDLVNLQYLQQVNLSYNRLGGRKDGQALPLEISHLDKVTQLDLSYNFLTILPTGVGLMEKLQWLNLSHNELADLPKGLSDSLTIETLDLSHNRLMYLPVELAEIPSLQHLILTGNPLPMYELRKIKKLLPKVKIEFAPVAPFEPNPAPMVAQSPEAQDICQTAQQLYQQGRLAQAIEHYKKAALLPDAWACYKIAQLLFAQKTERPQVVYWLLRASRLGWVAAQKTLAEHYDEVDDLGKARYWYDKAAAQGDAKAHELLNKLLK
jgi:Leucine-rich repeat (LRR) protein